MRTLLIIAAGLLLACVAHADETIEPELQSVAERSGFKATASHEDIMTTMDELQRRSPLVKRIRMGNTDAGKPIPVLVVADPPVWAPEMAANFDKIVVLMIGAIHAGEVCGKEALMMLARDIAMHPDEPEHRRILDNCVLLFAPIYNADGNDDMSTDNRPGQIGPEQGMGTRHTRQGYDLNRDHMKVTSKECQGLTSFFNNWNPELTIDTHTTNGSFHRYTLTYAAPQNPAGHSAPIRFVRDMMLPEITRRLRNRSGYETFFYGNYNNDLTEWHTYSHKPRFGTPYRGLRNRMSILSEAYAYAPYEDRVRCTYDFVLECLNYAAGHKNTIREILARAEKDTSALIPGTVGIRYERASFDDPVTILGYEMIREDENSRPKPTEQERDYEMRHFGTFEPTLSVKRPPGYVIEPGYEHIVEHLRLHGIRVDPMRVHRSMEVELYTIDSIERADKPFQKVRTVTIEATPERQRKVVPEGAYFVATTQPLGNLLVYLLEPESDDGLATWDMVDPSLGKGDVWPIWRIIGK